MKKLWFKAKRYGYGWYPASVEGWIVTLLFMVLILLLTVWGTYPETVEGFYTRWIPGFIILLAIFLAIAYKAGEKPRWRWGD